MSEAIATMFSAIFSLLDQALATWIPVLVVAGVFCKKIVKVNSRLLPLAEIGIGIVIALIRKLLGGGGNPIDVIGYSIGQGLLLAMCSMALYDTFVGVMRFIKEKSAASKEAALESEEEAK